MKKKLSLSIAILLYTMKYSILIFVLQCFFMSLIVAETTEAQNIKNITADFYINRLTLKEALVQLEKKTGFTFVYNANHIKTNKKITLMIKNVPFSEGLTQLLHPFNLNYTQVNNNIILHLMPVRKVLGKGSINGTVSDHETSEPLIGVTVRVNNTSIGGATDVKGFFNISSVPEGNYELIFSYIGYEEIRQEVKVEQGKTAQVNVKLKPTANSLNEVTVVGEKVHNNSTESSLLSEVKNSSMIITGISMQQITRSMDFDAGEVAKRLPGVTLFNNFVNIRGLHERYNMTFLNGMIAPSTEGDKRAFSYDLIPSNMLDRMIVYRSPAPELPADWGGGVIKIYTRNTTQSKQLQVQFSAQFRPGTSFKDYYTYKGGSRDWFGSDNGARDLPDGFPSIGAIPAGNAGVIGNTGGSISGRDNPDLVEQNALLGRTLKKNMNLENANSNFDKRASINYYDSWKFGNVKLNNLTSLSTTQSTQVITRNFSFDDGGETYEDTLSRKSSRVGLMENLSFVINENNQVEFRNLFNQLGTDEVLVRDGVAPTMDPEASFSKIRKFQYTYRSRSIYSGQLAGDHKIGLKKMNLLQWNLAYSYNKDNIPDKKNFQYGRPINDLPLQFYNSNLIPAIGRYFSTSFEKAYTAMVDFEKKLETGLFIRAGVFADYRLKNFDARQIFLNFNDPFSVEYSRPEYHLSEILSSENFKTNGSGLLIAENPYVRGQFEASNTIYAGYAGVNLPLFNKKLNIYGGVRYEWNRLISENKDRLTNSSYDSTTAYILPSVNASWSFSSKIIFRGAYGKTLNRPLFREIFNSMFYDLNTQGTTVGSDTLGNAEIHNFDLRMEYYPSQQEFISAGLFYKKLHNAIEYYIENSNRTDNYTPVNTPQAIVYGVEAEVRKSLSFIPLGIFQNISLISNMALIKSEVQFQDSLFSAEGKEFRKYKRQLEGTAPFLVNVGLYYDNMRIGSRFSILYNIIGSRLLGAGSANSPELYDMSRHVIDIVVRQRISRWLEVYGGVQDLLNQPFQHYKDRDRNQEWSRDKRNKLGEKDWMQSKYRPGSYYSIGLNLIF